MATLALNILVIARLNFVQTFLDLDEECVDIQFNPYLL